MGKNLDDCYNRRRIIESAGIPKKENLKLPFLSYGFFKPHQLAYSQIEEYVKGTPEDIEINYELGNVNGVPVLLNKSSHSPIKANIIKFKYPEREAYKTIGYSKNMHLYCWKVITVDGQKVNVLMYPENKPFPERSHGFGPNGYDWRVDPVFTNILDYVDFNIKGIKQHPFNYQWDDLKPFVYVQSLYITLWSAIDRFLTFRYGHTKTMNVKKFSIEPSFKKSLQKNYNAIGDNGFYLSHQKVWQDEIFSAEDLESYKLNPKNSTCSALYYYTLRNNVVH